MGDCQQGPCYVSCALNVPYIRLTLSSYLFLYLSFFPAHIPSPTSLLCASIPGLTHPHIAPIAQHMHHML